MKITLLSRYSRLGASSRLRSMQYLPSLQEAGIEITVHPFFDDDYIRNLYLGQRSVLRSAKYYFERARNAMAAKRSDLIWIEKEIMPWLPWFLESRMLPGSTPYIVDYDDAVFHRYDYDSKGLIRALLHDKIDRVMENAACVTVGNSYLSDRALGAGAKRVEWVPTVVDLRRYSADPTRQDSSRPRVGWIGTPKTWRGSAQPKYEAIRDSLEGGGATFRAIGASQVPIIESGFENVPWAEDEEVQQIQSLDIGIMPLQDDPWTRGKCGYKLIQYMACGVPVVASPVGVNSEIVRHGVNGFLAESDDEWRAAIFELLSDEAKRKSMGNSGRELIEARYSTQAWAPKIAEIFRSLV